MPCLSVLIFTALLFPAEGCTPAEKAETIATIQSALSTLTQNRQLAEQFVRDVKATGPSNPTYNQVLESYMAAREAYDRFLDDAEGEEKTSHTRSLHGRSPVEAQNTAAIFLEDATRALRPDVNTRQIPFQRAVVIPDNLSDSLHRLPKKARLRIIEEIDPQVRWRSWGEIR